jgi:hypothetical protein
MPESPYDRHIPVPEPYETTMDYVNHLVSIIDTSYDHSHKLLRTSEPLVLCTEHIHLEGETLSTDAILGAIDSNYSYIHTSYAAFIQESINPQGRMVVSLYTNSAIPDPTRYIMNLEESCCEVVWKLLKWERTVRLESHCSVYGKVRTCPLGSDVRTCMIIKVTSKLPHET